MGIKSILKELIHIHKFKTLIIYTPHTHRCDMEQCKDNDTYGFIVRCDCGYARVAKGLSEITKIL